MKVTTEELERCEVLMTIEIEPAQERDLLKKAARRISRKVRIPGFRRGKAPFNTIVRRFGREVVQQEVLEHSTEKIVTGALEKVGVEPYAQMKLDEISWNPLILKVKVPVKPKVELGNYRDIELEVEPVEVTAEDVEQALLALQEENATWAPVERPGQLGDLVSMSVIGKNGDKILIEDESVEYELQDADQPDFTTHLLGLSAGDSKTFTLTYPEEFENEELAGQEISFTVEVSGVKIKELDPLDDEFAQQVSAVDTLEELKELIIENITRQRERQRDLTLGFQVLDKIVENAEKLEWSLALEEENIDEELERYDQHLRESGMTLDSYLKVQNKTKEELREETRADVTKRIQRGLVLNKVANLEKLEVSQSEILEEAKAVADYSGGGDQVWRSVLTSETQQNTIARDLLSNKVLYRLAAIVKGEAPEPGADGEDAASDETANGASQATTSEDESGGEAAAVGPDADAASAESASLEGATSDMPQATADEDKSESVE